ncbi:hypothetical protein IMY05_C4828000100 [Salix suchowensis]|nr:hypothetical protein IMY05_C4828000100 [Salix suchowensis]
MFEVLCLFQILTFGSKVSGYKFYQALVRLTNNLGGPVPVSGHPRSLSIYLIPTARIGTACLCGSFKSGAYPAAETNGRGHEASGVSGLMKENVPFSAPLVPSQRRICLRDGKKQMNHNASNDARDPSLNRGCAYFVEEVQYKDFLQDHAKTTVDEASTCNNYDAVKLASIQGGKGTTASGVGTIKCSCHDMKRPSQSETYNGESRTYPQELVGTRATDLHTTYLVPKFHLYAHRTEYQINYSFNLTPSVGRMDGESPERGWAAVNPTSHFSQGARSGGDAREHVGNFLDFSDSLPAAIVQQFYALILQWEAGTSQENPYEAKKIRLELAQEEATAITCDNELVIHESVSPSILITQGLELQDQQARLKIDDQAIGAHPTELQRTHIIERRNCLMR